MVHAPDVSSVNVLLALEMRGGIGPVKGGRRTRPSVVLFGVGAALAPLGVSLALDLLGGFDQTFGSQMFTAATIALFVLALLVFAADVELLVRVAVLGRKVFQ